MYCLAPTGIPANASVFLVSVLRIVRYVLWAQVFLGVITVFMRFWDGFFLLLGALVLYFVIQQRNWYMCVCYILLAMFDGFGLILSTGMTVAHGKPLSGLGIIICFFALIRGPLYLVGCYYVFLSYRELKALYIEHYSSIYAEEQGWQPPAVPPQPRIQHFPGQGHSIG